MYLGAAYYPEHRDPLKWDFDLDQMAAASVNCLRVGEFAWTCFEPREGQFDFSWMDTFNEKAARRGIQLLMCPPLRTTPAWLVEKDPSILIETEDGLRLEYGSRYTFCINHPLLLEKGRVLAEVMARHYGAHANIAGWHLDNEHGDEPDCHCPICRVKFQRWCAGEYGSIEALNDAWGLAFWGLNFNHFSQVPTPRRSKTYHSPGHLLAWRRFRSQCTVESVAMQAETVRKDARPGQFITTNNQVWNPRTDYYEMDRHLDLTGTNYYPPYGDGSWFIPWALAACRGYKRQAFQVHEMRNGAHMIPGLGGNTPAPGEVERLTLHAVANGANGIFYFRWRACPFGAEQSHGTITDYDGRPKRVYAEVQRAFSALTRLNDRLESATIHSQAAVLHHFPTWWVMDSGSHWNGPTGLYLELEKKLYLSLRQQQINVDVTGASADFSGYRLLTVHNLAGIDDALVEKLVAFVEQGGTLLWHPLSGFKDSQARIYPDRLHPRLKEMLGVKIPEFLTLGDGEKATFTWQGRSYQGTLFCDLPEAHEAVAEGFYDSGWISGTPAVLRRRFGRGQCLYVSTFPQPAFYADFLAALLAELDIPPILGTRLPAELEVTERTGPDGSSLVFLCNTSAHAVSFTLQQEMEDVYHQEHLFGTVVVPPFGVRVLEN